MKHPLFLLPLVALLLACGQKSFDDRSEREARDYTARHCPLPVARGVMLDSMVYHRNPATILYYYTLSGQVDNADLIRHNAPAFKQELIKGIRNAVELKKYTDKGVRFVYRYKSATTGRRLLDVVIPPADYQ